MYRIFYFLPFIGAFLPEVIGAPATITFDIKIGNTGKNSAQRHPIVRFGGPEDDVPITDDDADQWATVELDYATYRPSLHNSVDDYVVFQNVRYAAPPTGPRRFATPEPPEQIDGVQNGTTGHSCHSELPNWLTAKLNATGDFDKDAFLGRNTDGEDCLFLDVATPTNYNESEALPVLVWITGGGFSYGRKDASLYRPAGLFQRGYGANKAFVFVSINYRLGAFGFLAGTTFTAEGGQPNAGFYDQRFALQWVQKYINKFGGDPSKVTVMGESAGGASIIHHLVWQDNTTTLVTPFVRAIVQSPGFVPLPNSPAGLDLQDEDYEAFANAAGCSTNGDKLQLLACLRNKDEKDLVKANQDIITKSPVGTFTFGPVVDGVAIQGLPVTLYAEGKANTTVKVMAGSVKAEGIPFVPLKLYNPEEDHTDEELKNFIQTAMPLIDDVTAGDILRDYPKEDYEAGKSVYYYPVVSQQTRRIADLAGQGLIQCNVRHLSKIGYGNDTYNYLLRVLNNNALSNPLSLPAIHAADVPFTFWSGGAPGDGINALKATNFQKYIMGFVIDGDPNSFSPTTNMVKYGENAQVMNVNGLDPMAIQADIFAGDRCDVNWRDLWESYGTSLAGGRVGIGMGQFMDGGSELRK